MVVWRKRTADKMWRVVDAPIDETTLGKLDQPLPGGEGIRSSLKVSHASLKDSLGLSRYAVICGSSV